MASKADALTIEHAGATVTVAPHRTPRMALNLSMTSYTLKRAMQMAVPQLYEGLPEPDMTESYDGNDDAIWKARIAYRRLDNELADYMTASMWVTDAENLDFEFPHPIDDDEALAQKIVTFVDSSQAGICTKVCDLVEAREKPDPKATTNETETS